jgi:hypothetical protein
MPLSAIFQLYHDKCLWNVVPLICECPLKLINRFRGINSSTDASSKLIPHMFKTNLKIVVGNLNCIRYRDEILAPIVLPFIRTHHFNHVFQQDNARCHISRVAMNFLNDQLTFPTTTINTHSSVAKFQIKLSVSPPPKTCTCPLNPNNPVSTL